jgi:PQ loop repeat
MVSKGLSIGIMLGAMTLKVPQIQTMFNKKTAQGVSVTAEVSDLLVYVLQTGYNYHYGNAFSTYGELVFLLFQTAVIIYATFAFGNLSFSNLALILGGSGALFAVFLLNLVPEGVYSYNMYTLIAISKT